MRRRSPVAIAVALGAVMLGLASGSASAETGAATPLGSYTERSLTLDVPDKLTVGRRITVRVEGTAGAGDEVSAFVDPNGGDCPSEASDEPARAVSLISEDTDQGAFDFDGTYRPGGAGDRTFCAYLGPAADRTAVRAAEDRSVGTRKLRGAVARRTVVTALERHGFARRVVKSIESDCRRRSRNAFKCKFFDRLPGYKLKGRGDVVLGVDLSYRFRVKAQGVRFTLTDENEEERQG